MSNLNKSRQTLEAKTGHHAGEIDESDVKRRPLKPGTSIDRYLIESIIGSGGFSVVYRGFHTRENKNVVVKEYFPNQFSFRDENDEIHPVSDRKAKVFQIGLQQFFSEAYSLSQINHPNVVNTTNIFRANNTAYMISELEEGRNLRWFIKRCTGGLDQKFIQKIIPPILSGINALHMNKLLHLDIKPGNILLRANGRPLLLDFGASKIMNEKERFTSFQTLTPGFAPPEQHLKEQLGPGSDIYALGATIYACILGQAPPRSLSREGKKRRLRLKGAENQVRQSVIDAVNWALETDIADRPQNVSDFANLFMRDSEWESFGEYERDLLRNHAVDAKPDKKERV